MKKIFFSLLLALVSHSAAFSFTAENFPDSFAIKKTQSCPGCVRLFDQGNFIGAMKLAPNRVGTYFLFDNQGQHRMSLKTKRIFMLGGAIDLDLIDKMQHKLGHVLIVRNFKSGQLMRFEIFLGEDNVPAILGVANLFGTKHTLYLRKTNHILAEIIRPLFTFSHDSEVNIIDKPALTSHIDPDALAIVLALYCSEYTLQVDETDEIVVPEEPPVTPKLADLEGKLKQIVKQRGFTRDDMKNLSQVQMQAAAELLNERYQQVYDDSQLSEEEKIVQFVNFSCDLILSKAFTPDQEMAMIQFLAHRLADIRLNA